MLTSGAPQQRKDDGSPASAHAAWKPHPMQGWSPDFIPKLTGDAVETGVIDRILRIANADAMRWSRELAQKEGIFVDITSGATFAGALRLRRRRQGLDDPVHAARYRRALSEHPALRRHPDRYDRGRGADLPLDPELLAATPGVNLGALGESRPLPDLKLQGGFRRTPNLWSFPGLQHGPDRQAPIMSGLEPRMSG